MANMNFNQTADEGGRGGSRKDYYLYQPIMNNP
jgi:hypothetical protein